MRGNRRRAASVEDQREITFGNARVGTSLAAANPHAESIHSHRQATLLEPANPDGHALLGDALRAAGDDAGAAEAYQHAVYLRPLSPELHLKLAHALLGARGFPQGWLELEWRLRTPARVSCVSRASVGWASR